MEDGAPAASSACGAPDVSVMRTCYAAVRASLEHARLEQPTYGSTNIALPEERNEEFSLWSFMTHVEWSKSMKRCTKALRATSKPTPAQLGTFAPAALQRDAVTASISSAHGTAQRAVYHAPQDAPKLL